MSKGVFVPNANSKSPDQLAEINSLIKIFTMLRYVLQYPIILQAHSEGPDQNARMRRLTWPSLSAYTRRHVFAQRGQVDLCHTKIDTCTKCTSESRSS